MPSSALDVLGMSGMGKTANLDFGSLSFGAMFKGTLDAQSPDSADSAPDASDPTAQIAALLQSGMPMSSIVDRIAQLIATAVQNAAPDAARGAPDLRTALETTIAKTLHPPGNAPPGTAAQQAAALAARLRQWIVGLARETQDAGQQNEFPGTLLDAKSAKDTPAQAQESKPKSTHVDAGLLAHSLMAQVAASLQSSSPVPPPNDGTPQVSAPAPQSSDASQPQQSPNAPDLLSRMLVRAAAVDERVNGNAAAIAIQAGPLVDGTPPTTAAFAAKFASALQTLVAQAAPQLRRDDITQPVIKRAPDAPQIAVGTMPSFSQSVQDAHTMPVAITTPVDAHAIVEQLVKSMVMRTDAQGTSQIRLHLSPAHLGDLSMKITVQGGTISASVVAQNADVRNALMTNQHQLARSLADAGLSLAGFSVDVSGGDARSRQDRDRTAGFGRRYVVHELGGTNEGDAATISSLGPALLPHTSLGLFNYLA